MGILTATTVRLARRLGTLLVTGFAPAQALDSGANLSLFSRAPLLPAWLRALEADVTVSADSIEWRGNEVREARLPIAIHDRALALRDGRAKLAGGADLGARSGPWWLGYLPALTIYRRR